MADRKYSSIQLTEETKAKIRKLGKMGDSYESIILRLLDTHKGKKDKR